MGRHQQIELEARRLLAEIEHHAPTLWPHTVPSRISMCNPEAACQVLGLQYLPDSHLGIYGTATAGMLDRANRAVMVSFNQNYEALRFTAAHEVGHWVLHPDHQLFRDRSLSMPGGPGRPMIELEADRFAGCFLAPPKLVQQEFRARFSVREPITNTGTVCFNLRDGARLESLPPHSLEFAVAIARATFFNGIPFKSLANVFGMSPMAMGIRLQELGLVD